jgi:hypothetical protein
MDSRNTSFYILVFGSELNYKEKQLLLYDLQQVFSEVYIYIYIYIYDIISAKSVWLTLINHITLLFIQLDFYDMSTTDQNQSISENF